MSITKVKKQLRWMQVTFTNGASLATRCTGSTGMLGKMVYKKRKLASYVHLNQGIYKNIMLLSSVYWGGNGSCTILSVRSRTTDAAEHQAWAHGPILCLQELQCQP